MSDRFAPDLVSVIGGLPFRIALAGGWIDQPFVSRLNPSPPGSMVVVRLAPKFRFMDRAGMGTSTRRVALRLWGDKIPDEDPQKLMRDLYWAENEGKTEPSGSQDMAGIIFPGISRLDYDARSEKGVFPAHIESCTELRIVDWLTSMLYILPVMQRPEKYNPLTIQNLDPSWIQRLGQTGKDCYRAVLECDLLSLGESMNTCMACWEAILPNTLSHPSISLDLIGLAKLYQSHYPGAMYSGCGGGYLLVVSEEPVPGAFQVNVSTG